MSSDDIKLKGQKIAIWGTGREGKAALAYCESLGLSSAVIDEKNENSIFDYDVIIKSPGISLYKNIVQEALRKGIRFTSVTNLFLQECKDLIRRPTLIAITGTKGKSTTSALTAHMLQSLGFKVFLGGNFGRPLTEALVDLHKYDFIVAEISSYQAADLQYGFDVALLNNLHHEHLNWHGSYEQYYHDKFNLLSKSKVKIFNAADEQTVKQVKDSQTLWFNSEEAIHYKDKYFWEGSEKLFDAADKPLHGEHNLWNICAALTVVKALGVDYITAGRAVTSFKPLPHRLEIVAEKDGLIFVDDSISTIPETALAALEVFKEKPVTLIAGGFDRGQNYAGLVRKAIESEVKVIALPSTGKRIASEIKTAGGEVYEVSNMQEAVNKAKEITLQGGVVLLSPAAPSYDFYRNFEERGSFFKSFI